MKRNKIKSTDRNLKLNDAYVIIVLMQGISLDLKVSTYTS